MTLQPRSEPRQCRDPPLVRSCGTRWNSPDQQGTTKGQHLGRGSSDVFHPVRSVTVRTAVPPSSSPSQPPEREGARELLPPSITGERGVGAPVPHMSASITSGGASRHAFAGPSPDLNVRLSSSQSVRVSALAFIVFHPFPPSPHEGRRVTPYDAPKSSSLDTRT